MLENPDRVMALLSVASDLLGEAHRMATETEEGVSGLSGPTRDVIFGLNTAVEGLRLLVESRAEQKEQCPYCDEPLDACDCRGTR
jgi:hypothetical protein